MAYSWDRSLKSIGKRCFINCFELAMQKNGDLSHEDILREDPECPDNYHGLIRRATNIKAIFKNGQQQNALRSCTEAVKGNPTANEKAKTLYKKYYGE